MSSNELWSGDTTKGQNTEKTTDSMEDAILTYLNQKYGETFQMVQLTREFNGNNGIYYRAVFYSEKRPEKGVLYCYQEDAGDGTALIIDGDTYFLRDDYANILLQSEYAASLQELLGDGVMVKCQLYTDNHMLTNEEYAAGLRACLENADLFPKLYVFVFADISQADGNLKTAVETHMAQYNVYRQYLYIAYQPQIDFGHWENLYYENETNFESYLMNESAAERVEYSFFSLDKGFVRTEVVKG